MRAAQFTPLGEYPGANKPWLCVHEPCGVERQPTLNNIRRGDLGCRECGRRAKGHRVWTAQSAAEALRAAGLEPLEPYPGSSTRAWKARHVHCGSVVSPRLVNIAEGQGPCNVCGRHSQADTRLLTDKQTRQVMLAAGLEPLARYPGYDEPWLCRHVRCGREVRPSYANTKKGQSGCLPCSWEAASVRNRMPEADAEAGMSARGLLPLVPYPGSNRPWLSEHSACGRTVSPTLSNVLAGRGICRYCYSAFPFDGPAQLYLVGNATALKVGICAPGSDRLRQHRRWGWSVLWLLDVPDGDQAWALEQMVLGWWRNALCLPPAMSPAEMPQGGATETVARDRVSPAEVRALVQSYRASSPTGSPKAVDGADMSYVTPAEGLARPTGAAPPVDAAAGDIETGIRLGPPPSG
jgi:hypothetical protein